MTVFESQPARHDHTPAYTSALSQPIGAAVTLRVWTSLPVSAARLKLLRSGEVELRPTREVPGAPGGRTFEYTLHPETAVTRYAWELDLPGDHLNLTMSGLHHTRRSFRDWFQYVAGDQLGHTPVWAAPEWAWKTVFYQIFPDRFRNGDPSTDVQTGEYLYNGRPVEQVAWDTPPDKAGDIHAHYGGDLPGITQALPYLTELGIGGLWLTPIFTSPSNHRYDISDYRQIDPHLGGQAAFDELLARAHAAGVRVVLDGVFNHVGERSELFQKALAGVAGREMFTWRDGQQPPYSAFFDVPTLPKLDYTSAAARTEFLDGEDSVVRHWLRQGIDGWRLDVAHMIGGGGTDEGNLELHRALKRAAREENPQAYIFGERFFDPEQALRGDGEDGAMGYHGFGLPVMQWLSGASQAFRPSKLDGHELAELLWDAYHALSPQVALSMFNLLDSHDTPRALYRLGQNTTKLRAALTLLLGYPGVPCIFAGTEVGVTQQVQGDMPYCRTTMPWDEGQLSSARWDHALRADVQALIALRRQHVALERGSLRMLHAEPDALGYIREWDGQRVIVLASRRGEAHPVRLTLPAGDWHDARSGEVQRGEVTLDACGGRMLVSA